MLALRPMWPIIASIPMPFGWGPLRIPAFGLMVVLAFLTSTSLMKRLAAREGIPPAKLEPLFMILLVGIIAGGRLFHVLTNLDDFKDNWLDVVRIDKGGMVMYGGMIAVVVGGLWYLFHHKLPVWPIADIGAVCGALGLGIGRIGCTLAGCDYGKPVDPSFPLAVRFPTHTQTGDFFGITVPVLRQGATQLAPEGWLHPTQVYQSLAGFLTAIILYVLWKRRSFPGQVFCAVLILKPLYRFIIEFYRGDEDRGIWRGLSQAQVIGMVVAAAGAALWIFLWRRSKRVSAVPTTS